MSDMAQKIGELKGKAEVKADEVKMKAGELKGKAEAKLDELKKDHDEPVQVTSRHQTASNPMKGVNLRFTPFPFEPQSVPHDAVGRSGPRFRAGLPRTC